MVVRKKMAKRSLNSSLSNISGPTPIAPLRI
jgi:hypothetical protein